jgi:hypothetical protein
MGPLNAAKIEVFFQKTGNNRGRGMPAAITGPGLADEGLMPDSDGCGADLRHLRFARSNRKYGFMVLWQ